MVDELIQEEKLNRCHGCAIQHPSQRQHSCVMMGKEDSWLYYREDVVEKIDLNAVLNNVERVCKALGFKLGQSWKVYVSELPKMPWTSIFLASLEFYLHLPSNSSLDKFPNNTLTEYHVGLPQTVSLTGDWEVALTEIHYPHSWNNVQGNFGNRFFLRNQELSGVWEVLIIPPGHYSSIEDILSKMKGLIENVKRFNNDVTFSYDTFTRKVTVHLQNNVELFFGNIGFLLGFSPEEIISNTSTAERQVDLEYGFHDLLIYCDIIQSQYVGDALAPLLRIVPVEGKVGERVSKSFLHPQYLPVSRKQFETVEVDINTDTGESCTSVLLR
ncbi:unnamed protein product [Porites evermanni]|uniref:Uncharacterized protein n=1 Tax=Porites evermanni TaxID=104178 RepID=A0ABN8QN15_9CNID|nr:unnamed protein product [Porites evermanni]